MSKQDFVAIADILCFTNASKRTVREFTDYFQRQNPNFKAARFEAATRSCKR